MNIMKDMEEKEAKEYEKSINKLYKSTGINIYDLTKDNIMSYNEIHDIFLLSSKNNSITLEELKRGFECFKKDKNELSINKIYATLLNPDKKWTSYLDSCLKLINVIMFYVFFCYILRKEYTLFSIFFIKIF